MSMIIDTGAPIAPPKEDKRHGRRNLKKVFALLGIVAVVGIVAAVATSSSQSSSETQESDSENAATANAIVMKGSCSTQNECLIWEETCLPENNVQVCISWNPTCGDLEPNLGFCGGSAEKNQTSMDSKICRIVESGESVNVVVDDGSGECSTESAWFGELFSSGSMLYCAKPSSKSNTCSGETGCIWGIQTLKASCNDEYPSSSTPAPTVSPSPSPASISSNPSCVGNSVEFDCFFADSNSKLNMVQFRESTFGSPSLIGGQDGGISIVGSPNCLVQESVKWCFFISAETRFLSYIKIEQGVVSGPSYASTSSDEGIVALLEPDCFLDDGTKNGAISPGSVICGFAGADHKITLIREENGVWQEPRVTDFKAKSYDCGNTWWFACKYEDFSSGELYDMEFSMQGEIGTSPSCKVWDYEIASCYYAGKNSEVTIIDIDPESGWGGDFYNTRYLYPLGEKLLPGTKITGLKETTKTMYFANKEGNQITRLTLGRFGRNRDTVVHKRQVGIAGTPSCIDDRCMFRDTSNRLVSSEFVQDEWQESQIIF